MDRSVWNLSPSPISRIFFRAGANPDRVISQIRNKLRIPAAAVQIPIGAEDGFRGVVDLIRWKAIYNDGTKGYITFFKASWFII